MMRIFLLSVTAVLFSYSAQSQDTNQLVQLWEKNSAASIDQKEAALSEHQKLATWTNARIKFLSQEGLNDFLKSLSQPKRFNRVVRNDVTDRRWSYYADQREVIDGTKEEVFLVYLPFQTQGAGDRRYEFPFRIYLRRSFYEFGRDGQLIQRLFNGRDECSIDVAGGDLKSLNGKSIEDVVVCKDLP